MTALSSQEVESWRVFCGEIPGVVVHQGSILDLECDAVVSPANSFGFMDGGIDGTYLNFFGPSVQTRVRRQILEQHGGELVVGQADIVETGHERIPYLIAAPTMRVPMILPPETVNPYLAARAVLRLIQYGTFQGGSKSGEPMREHVRSVAFPGLGTGVGRVSFHTCARQMQQAIADVVREEFQMPRSWAEASERHQLLYTDRPRRLQY